MIVWRNETVYDQRFRQCGFDEDEQNDMGMSMMEWAEKKDGSR